LPSAAALVRVRAHAYAHDVPVAVVVHEIVTRQLALEAEE
jgi:hypothetical protein